MESLQRGELDMKIAYFIIHVKLVRPPFQKLPEAYANILHAKINKTMNVINLSIQYKAMM